MNEELREIFELNNSLLRLAENLQDQFSARKIKTETLSSDLFVLCFFFAKASKTASGVVRLCQQGFAEDALVLVRTIFEMVVRLFYIFKSDSIDRARGYILYGHLDRRNQLRKVAEWHKQQGIQNKEVVEQLKKEEEICNTLEKDFQISSDKLQWPKKTLKELSKEVGLIDKYLTFYWRSSLYGHTTIDSSTSFVSKSERGLSFDIKPDVRISEEVLIYLFDFFGRLTREFDTRFNLGYQSKITEVEEKFKRFVETVI